MPVPVPVLTVLLLLLLLLLLLRSAVGIVGDLRPSSPSLSLSYGPDPSPVPPTG